jgi:hypothetical protein
LYDGELGEGKQPLLSPCSSGIGDVNSPSADSVTFPSFDLNPLFEQSSDLWNLLTPLGENEKDSPLQEIDSLKPSITDLELDSNSTLFNVEDALLDEKDMLKGPTLAALNSGDMDCDLRWESYTRPPLMQQRKTSNAPAALSTPLASLPPTPQVCSPTLATPSSSALLNQHSLPEQAAMLPPVTTTVQYVTFPGGKTVTQPFPTAPPLVSSAQVIASNPCINQLLIPIKQEPVEAPTQQKKTLPAVKVETPMMQGVKRSLSPDNDSNSSIESKWKDIENLLKQPRQAELIPAKKIKSEPVDFAFTPQEETGSATQAAMEDEVFDSGGEEDNSDRDSDNEFSDVEPNSSFIEEFISSGRKEKRFFWQYNLQSKGPKGKRLAKSLDTEDPHILQEFEDPVFDPDQQDMKYKHNGKARRGDGNDITPNPYRLFQIGNELNKLNRHINSIAPVVEMPQGARNRKRKEKNKFASRACRLKKKAQHEANKLKLYGLDQEHSQLMSVLQMGKNLLKARLHGENKEEGPMVPLLDNLIRSELTCGMVAGNTADYVNSVLEKVAKGDKTGGLQMD